MSTANAAEIRNVGRYPMTCCARMPTAGPIAIASAFIVPYRPMPAPMWRIGSSMAIQAARQTEQHAKPTPLSMRAAISDAGSEASAYQTLDARYSAEPNDTIVRLLMRSDRLPAIGRQNSETKFIAAVTNPISAPPAPRLSENPAISGDTSILLAMKQNVAAITSTTSRFNSRSSLRSPIVRLLPASPVPARSSSDDHMPCGPGRIPRYVGRQTARYPGFGMMDGWRCRNCMQNMTDTSRRLG